MMMYAIMDNDDYYWNFRTKDFQFDISSECLLPIKEMAFDYIEDYLPSDCEVAMVSISRLTANGDMEYIVGKLRGLGESGGTGDE